MKRRLIFHIGAHRTATSALQDYLADNKRQLRSRGVVYPFQVRRHLKQMNALFTGRRDPAELAETLTARADKRDADIHTILLSDEDICMREDLGLLARFREWFDVKIVFTLRRQDTWLESWFFQNIKWQWNPKLAHCTFDEFMAQRESFHWIHYDRYVRHLEDLFGAENLILNVMEKDQMPDGPIAAFSDSIGLTDRTGFTEPSHMNASFSPEISEFMRCLPLDAAPVEYRNQLTSACAQIDAKRGRNTKSSERLLPHADRVALMAEYDPGNRALARRHFDREMLFLEPLPGPDAPLARMELPGDSYALMEEFVAPLLSALIGYRKEEMKAKAEAEGTSKGD